MKVSLGMDAFAGRNDHISAAGWGQLTESAASVADGGSLVLEISTVSQVARVLAAAMECSPKALAPSAGGITVLTVHKEDRTLQQVACFNHCGHL